MATKTQANPSILNRGIEEVIVREHLENALKSGAKLRVKLGMDPTSPDLHLGHAVILHKLRQFQEAGHTIVLIIGDYTARIGDPSGKSKTRPALNPDEIDANAKTYLKQVGKILDVKKIEVHKNSEWLKKLGFADLLKLASQFTVARITERDDFQKRLKEGVDVAMHELLYPMMQAYDSVAISASVECGGTDQKFNMLAGRELQKKMGLPEQDIVTFPLLVGLDGEHKMSKSLGNYIGITESADSMYGKVMTIPDRLIMHYFELATVISDSELETVRAELTQTDTNPRDLKMRLAREIVALYHDEGAARDAEANFIKTFRNKEVPENVPEQKITGRQTLAEVLVAIGFAASKSEARRTIEQKGVKVEGQVVEDPMYEVEPTKDGVLIQKGKRFFVRIVK